ncbi:hypothetical protein PsYK624_060500 [Phanerochaete sordida]|uniref:Uncharacterized protein n=1 Tax=Phanerochaete sordida TaxID=48140 RepID=A0A9P3LDH4_9APHY|nr:hypothetical protein PsYK624_060500 [Phanerochaete sordida]
MATATFTNPFPDSPVAVVISPPLNANFAVLPGASAVAPVLPGTFLVMFTKQEQLQPVVSVNNIDLEPDAQIDIGMYFPPPFPPARRAPAGVPDTAQVDYTVLNDTPAIAAVRFGAAAHGPSVAVGVGQSVAMCFGAEALASFGVAVAGRSARVNVTPAEVQGPVTLRLSSVFPQLVHGALGYTVDSLERAPALPRSYV